MTIRVFDGQFRKYRRGGSLSSDATATVPEGEFLKRSGSGDEYTVIDSTSPAVVYLNLVSTDRGDCTTGGVAVIGGEPYELETDVYYASATFTLDGPVTVKQAGTSVSGILTNATSGDQILGYVTQVPAAGNGNMLRVAMLAASAGTVA